MKPTIPKMASLRCYFGYAVVGSVAIETAMIGNDIGHIAARELLQR